MKNLSFGKKLAEVRKAKGLTQNELAERCSLDIRTIQRIELGEVSPRAYTVKAISEVLEFNFFEVSNTGGEANKKSLHSKLKWYVTDLFNLKTNAMRKVFILTTFCLIAGFVTFAVVEASAKKRKPEIQHTYLNTPERVELMVCRNFTIDTLNFIKEDLAKRGIEIIYDDVKFDEKGRLLSISYTFKLRNGGDANFSYTGFTLDVPKLNEGVVSNIENEDLDEEWGLFLHSLEWQINPPKWETNKRGRKIVQRFKYSSDNPYLVVGCKNCDGSQFLPIKRDSSSLVRKD